MFRLKEGTNPGKSRKSLLGNEGVFDDFPKISDHFPKISVDFPKLFRRSDEHFRTMLIELEFENVGFSGGTKTGVAREKRSEYGKIQQQTQRLYDTE